MIPRLFGSPWHFQATPTIDSSVRLLQPLRYSVVVDDVVVAGFLGLEAKSGQCS